MRTEIAVALIHRSLTVTDRPAAWLTRAGVPQPHDLDMAWIPVLHRAFGMPEVAPHAVAVVTKTGWYDPLNEDGAHWQRQRVSRQRPVCTTPRHRPPTLCRKPQGPPGCT